MIASRGSDCFFARRANASSNRSTRLSASIREMNTTTLPSVTPCSSCQRRSRPGSAFQAELADCTDP